MYIVFLILLGIITLDCIWYDIKYHRFKNKLKPGMILSKTIKEIDNEFDEPHTFIIQIIKVGDKQVKVRWSDDKRTTMNIQQLYDEHWTFVDDANHEND